MCDDGELLAMRNLLIVLVALISPLSSARAQLFSPWNVEGMPGAYLHPFTHTYRPMLLVQWDPSVTRSPIKLHSVGVQVELVMRELVVFHPPGWTGTCGFGTAGTRLRATNWRAMYQVWYWGGGSYGYWRNLGIRLNAPGEIMVDYGNWFGACPYQPKPMLCAMVLEVGL